VTSLVVPSSGTVDVTFLPFFLLPRPDLRLQPLSLHLHATIPAIIKIFSAPSRRQQPLSTRRRPPCLSATSPCIQRPITEHIKHECPLRKTSCTGKCDGRIAISITSYWARPRVFSSSCRKASVRTSTRGTKHWPNQMRMSWTPPNNLHAEVPFACRLIILLCFVRMGNLLRRGLF
jgi:hypothetical protein